jgi:predicted molibdopterin-dependent oxidoreductase YjgC
MTAVRLFSPTREVRVMVDGQPLMLAEGMMLASALACADRLALRKSPRLSSVRGAFCLMGACQECAIHVDGQLRQACQTPVREGMEVELRGVP